MLNIKIISIAKHWHGILCKRGSLGILGVFIKDDFKCTFKNDVRPIIANANSVFYLNAC